MKRRITPALIVSSVFAFAAPPAFAVDRYVDNAGAGSPPCTDPMNPCGSISMANGSSAAGDVIHVGGGLYTTSTTLTDGVSVREDDFRPPLTSGDTILDGGVNAALIAGGTLHQEIRGLTLRGGNGSTTDDASLEVNGPTTVVNNVFDDKDSDAGRLLFANGAGPIAITGNTFEGDTDAINRGAIVTVASGQVEIANNAITSFHEGVHSNPPSGQIAQLSVHDNTITGIYQPLAATPHGIYMPNRTNAAISDNVITSAPAQTGGSGIAGDVSTSTAPLQSRRNEITGFFNPAIDVSSTGTNQLSSVGDVLADNRIGIAAFQLPTTVENSTIANNSVSAINLNSSPLTVDSSILTSAISGGSSCAITFSRGPTTSGTSCQTFQTNADPQFVGSGNYHLVAGSPMIDAGNPASPASATDYDGEPRSMDGDGDALVRRDIGADERPDTFASGVEITSGPSGTTESATATFTFTTNPADSAALLECRFDGAAFAPCDDSTGPDGSHSRELAPGDHVFDVRAVDPFENIGTASQAFTITTPSGGGGGPNPDTDPPETTLKKAKVKGGDDVVLKFSSDEPGSRFQCKRDQKPFKRCKSPKRYKNLDDGKHRFLVRAIDPAGNVDASAAKKRLKID